MKTKIFLFAITLAFTGVQVNAQSTSSPLNGKKYQVELLKEGSKDAAMIQTLVFVNEMMQTPGFNAQGFKESRAYVKPAADYFNWVSTINSDKEGAMGWQGTVKGDKIEGTVVWRKAGTQAATYHFQGTEVKNTGK